ncbi:hypothetical protein [Bifidobacterium myosotis]|uniref:Uncharacterized protein n=1 Tax=Bifidobacterium myosotis TaxID=1630166 RepID=A0A5M9ZKF5_9BIFI|nr:hypothetical protein [Bifidobacterium myosotis]KAA8828107.1 hypothetical protein EMO91_06615 [Bifidobacterium myosotis]
MSDDSSIIGTARYENSSSGYNPNYSWSFDSSIKPYVKSDGGYRAKAVNANGVSYEKGNPLDSKVVLGLKNRPPVDTAGTVINQSPTAGAPVSDLTIPALAVGGGLAALGFGLSRRRRA